MQKALALVRDLADPDQARNLLREYLHAFILRSLHESEAFLSLAFLGGTALRFLHDLPRFSEDLDFSLVPTEGAPPAQPLTWLAKGKRDLAMAGFQPEVTWNDRQTVQVAWIKLPGLLAAAGLSDRPEQKLSIKLEIDSRPPEGAMCERRIVTRHLTFLIRHLDLPSLMAGKLHALLTRPHVKGRDWFDLVWYLSHRPPIVPHLPFLQAALDQTQGPGRFAAADWKSLVRARLDSLSMTAVRRDVLAFLERPTDAALLTRDNLATLLAENP